MTTDPAPNEEWDDPQPCERREETVGQQNVQPEIERELVESGTK